MNSPNPSHLKTMMRTLLAPPLARTRDRPWLLRSQAPSGEAAQVVGKEAGSRAPMAWLAAIFLDPTPWRFSMARTWLLQQLSYDPKVVSKKNSGCFCRIM